MKVVLGFDGGGTKTECVVMSTSGGVLSRARGPASNPTRIGFSAAMAGVTAAANAAIRSLRDSAEVVALCAGLAGTGQPEYRSRMQQALEQNFPQAVVDVRTDLELPLAATPAGPAMVLIVGTGSAAIGRDAAGTIRREGGLGPAGSDEGSAFDIGRQAVAASRGEDSSEGRELARQIFRHLGLANWSEIDARAVAQADTVFPRIFPVVAAAADAGNPLAQALLRKAATQLAAITSRLAESLGLQQQSIPLGKTGGTVGRSRFFDEALDRELAHVLPDARISILLVDPAEVAAAVALQLYRSKMTVPP